MRPESRCDSLTWFLSDFVSLSLIVLTSFPASLLVNNFSIPLNLSGFLFLSFFFGVARSMRLAGCRVSLQWILRFYYFVFPPKTDSISSP